MFANIFQRGFNKRKGRISCSDIYFSIVSFRNLSLSILRSNVFINLWLFFFLWRIFIYTRITQILRDINRQNGTFFGHHSVHTDTMAGFEMCEHWFYHSFDVSNKFHEATINHALFVFTCVVSSIVVYPFFPPFFLLFIPLREWICKFLVTKLSKRVFLLQRIDANIALKKNFFPPPSLMKLRQY